MKKFDKKELNKIVIMGFLLTVCIFLTYYFHFLLKTEVIFTHLFYIPILLASLWWARKGIIVSVCLAVMLLVINLTVSLELPIIYSDLIRASMFIIIGTMIGILSEKKLLLEGKLRAYSKDLEQRVEERTSEVRGLQEKQRAILDGISDAVIVLDNNLNVIWANKIAKDQYGFTPGKKCYEAYKGKKELCFDCITKKTFKDGIVRSSEEEAILKNGRHFNFILSCSPIRDSQGEIISVVEVFHDITERKKDQEKLKKHQEHLEELVEERTRELKEAQGKLIRKEKLAVIGQLAGSMGHELRNPLGVIGNSIYYLNMILKHPDEKVLKHLNILRREIKRSDNIVSDLLDFSRVQSSLLTKSNLNTLIKDTTAEIKMPEQINLETELDEKLPQIPLDPEKIKQVIHNMISNAIGAISGQGKLKIKTRGSDDFVEMIFHDSGEGIPQENLNKIFEPLFTSKAKGIGLGLPIVKNIIDHHNGKIEVESEVGKGTTFIIKLPIKMQKKEGDK